VIPQSRNERLIANLLGPKKAFIQVIEGLECKVRAYEAEILPLSYLTMLTITITRSLEMWYLHAPDHTVPYEITFKAVNDLYNEGYFKRLGISNYSS
jgi:aflatoxin B1 aldehyde reductase